MNPLTPEQTAAIRELREVCGDLGAQVVLIGAMAYRFWVRDLFRHTEDVDIAVALDLDDFDRLASILSSRGWTRDGRNEHRWRTLQGARLDILPAGPNLRRKGVLEWPRSGMRMSLAGFEHVFEAAVEAPLSKDLSVKIIPVAVLALLKIAAYLDNPAGREKDIEDLATLLRRYEPGEERRYSDEVLKQQLDHDLVGAYWVGKELGRLCNAQEAELVTTLLSQLLDVDQTASRVFRRTIEGPFEDTQSSWPDTLIHAFGHGFRSGGDTFGTVRPGS
jgi:predicted nucleotidyltransferase